VSKRTYRLCRMTITAAIAILIVWSIAAGNAIVPVFTIAGGMGLMYLLSRRVKGVLRDERTYHINEKACRFAMGVFGPMIAVASAVLIALSKTTSPELASVGLTLAYSACVLVLIYYGFYMYYSSKS